jgi:hypothetical protein
MRAVQYLSYTKASYELADLKKKEYVAEAIRRYEAHGILLQ